MEPLFPNIREPRSDRPCPPPPKPPTPGPQPLPNAKSNFITVVRQCLESYHNPKMLFELVTRYQCGLEPNAWRTLEAGLQREVIARLCAEWNLWGPERILDADGLPFKGQELWHQRASYNLGRLVALYRETQREDPEIEQSIATMAKQVNCLGLWLYFLSDLGRLRAAMALVLETHPSLLWTRESFPDGESLTWETLWRAQQVASVAKYCELYEACNQKDADAEKAVLDYAERAERYDLVLQVLERFNRVNEAQQLLDEIPPHIVWGTEENPDRCAKAYRERLAFKAARRRKGSSLDDVNKEELERMLALGEITEAEFERQNKSLESD